MIAGRVLSVAALALLIAVFGVPRAADAQAWAPPAGTGSVTLGVQRTDHTGHRLTNGMLISEGTSLNVVGYLEVAYALTGRLAVSAALPWVFGRYTDDDPPPPFIPFLPIDQCRCWNGGPQDFSFAGRFNLANGGFALTPSVAVVLPSHNYDYKGEAVLGRHLKELRIGVDVGQRLDLITPRLAVSGNYEYAIVERVLDLPNDRSTATVSTSYFIHRTLSVHGMLAWQRTHGGLRIGSPPPSDLLPPGDVNTAERLAQHDRLLRDNSTHAGFSFDYGLPRFDVFVSYRAFLTGTDTHAGRAVTTGINWPFKIGR